ncbi:hypothetical protein BDW22DRAFT_1330234 [Trametopsis cervina]|nr:hypothetical protein BDW22DRAFT_1330234 [Trametopsis cervina]
MATPPPSQTGRSELALRLGPEITDTELAQCARLFSSHYGVWGTHAPPPLRPGNRVKMSATKLRAECLSDVANSAVVMCFVDGELVGHACATRWTYGAHIICWITQLVVALPHRRRGIATSLLTHLSTSAWFERVTAVGVASSHPIACHTTQCVTYTGTPIASLDLSFIRTHAPGILASSPAPFLRGRALRGSLFHPADAQDEKEDDGTVSLVDTAFFVAHEEPQTVLDEYKHTGEPWVLGGLAEGYEFCVIAPLSECS